MEWLIGIYLLIGVFGTLARMSGPAPLRPAWLSARTNPIKIAFYFALNSLFWPLVR